MLRRRRTLWRCAVVLVLLALLALTHGAGSASIQTGVLMMSPALCAAVMMLTRPYLGQGILARLSARRRRPGAPRARSRAAHPRAHLARGGRLIASALAGRAPPSLPAACPG